ncbi:MSMEG_0572 family nitrogen starvation response protein [Conexibacter sp. W3-3-2]|uniref:MSMEG_0572 family nitrogen starvation response protein n=1 Tax=Paraconexibacter algicola TaxID=2133960 RepID=A0A2T4UG28_9ACTN|nr:MULTISPECIES: MSMEG_0572/Sll0783 family nitrogen starvation response protein [Solirubrobacterales]MTD44438.1 MSMEG_0572 family nitrogen starvation response protein [Conexibacter sp. W3-3-2]PTL58203.1 MSMEG_0572 family nitrogen starvation response protein [Paraconexibacter algicola]
MAVEPKLTDQEIASLMEIPHPSKAVGDSLYGETKVFPDYQAEPGETYFGLVHGIVHESSVSFVAVLQAIRAQKKGFDSALYFYGIGSLNCLATRGFPTVGNELFPGMRNENNVLERYIGGGGKVYACRLGLALHGAREEDLIEGVIPCHPLDLQDALIEYARKGAIINSSWMF